MQDAEISDEDGEATAGPSCVTIPGSPAAGSVVNACGGDGGGGGGKKT